MGAEPLRLAGGHSFATDLLEIAGATSVTHGESGAGSVLHGEGAVARVTDATALRALAPDLLVLMLPEGAPLEGAVAALPGELPWLGFPLDATPFWAEPEPDRVAKALSAEIRRALAPR